MTGPLVSYFVKFFSEEQHADQFLKGHLYLNRLSYFKKLESSRWDGRPDPTEAIAMWWQPHNFMMDLNIPGIGAVKIIKDDLAGPVSMSFDHHNHLHVFCLYAMYATGYKATIDGKLDIAPSDVDDLKKQFAIDSRCLEFGSHAVVTAVGPFLAQLKDALKRRRLWFKADLVEYYDDRLFHGEIPPRDIPFRKQNRFSYQKEYRICVQTNSKGTNPISIEMGDISQFSAKMDSARINSLMELKLEPAAVI